MDEHKCDECGEEFISVSKEEQRPDDRRYVTEERACDIIDGQYTEWWQIKCPKCLEVVEEW